MAQATLIIALLGLLFGTGLLANWWRRRRRIRVKVRHEDAIGAYVIRVTINNEGDLNEHVETVTYKALGRSVVQTARRIPHEIEKTIEQELPARGKPVHTATALPAEWMDQEKRFRVLVKISSRRWRYRSHAQRLDPAALSVAQLPAGSRVLEKAFPSAHASAHSELEGDNQTTAHSGMASLSEHAVAGETRTDLPTTDLVVTSELDWVLPRLNLEPGTKYILNFEESGDAVGMHLPRMTKLLAGQRILLGRSGNAMIHCSDPSVSREHAEIRVSNNGSEVRIADLDSTNGTYVNGLPVGVRILNDHDVVWLGRHRLVYIASLRTSEGAMGPEVK